MRKRFNYIYISSFINFSFALTLSSFIYIYNVLYNDVTVFYTNYKIYKQSPFRR